ncbi:MAG TPA: AarF/UbiB family protein [Actinomycetota bacterium]|jgi:predicted unusual protein kinase regulating ubiquinone biosynthesis (AarF/ABC1/UbiB family)/nucleotide-binding universal stress UspA family protein
MTIDALGPVARVMVGTDRSETAERAVQWATSFADRFAAELYVVQVIVPSNPADTEYGAAERTRAAAAGDELHHYAQQLAGERGHARVVVDDDPAMAIVQAAEDERIDVLVVGNAGMAGRKEFLLGNVPNRISHNARCTVIIVNTISPDGKTNATPTRAVIRRTEPAPTEPRLISRGSRIAAVMAKHGLKELFGRPDEEGTTGQRRQAKRLREALEELGPTFAKLGQVLSTRPDLLPPEFIDELAQLQDNVPPLTEEQVVKVMEEELGVPWEDVFESIEPNPLAAGTIAEVHRATLASGERVVIKVQRPNAREEIEQDLALLEVFAEKVGDRPGLRQVIDMASVFEHLSSSLHRELDFRQEASNIERMRLVLSGYERLDVPGVYGDLSTSRLLVMEEIQGVSISLAPEGDERTEAARQLLESYYKQILTDGFFHADPHPGNLMWWRGKIYFLDFGMVGEVGADIREHLMLLLMAFWQEDVGFLTDVTLMMTGAIDRSDLDVGAFQEEIGALMAKNRGASLSDMQLGPILQEMSEIALRHQVPLPASLTLTGKALAQVQLATADLDPTLDPFDVAGKFLMRQVLHGMGAKLDPKALFYQSQRLKVRFLRVVEAVERLIGARPGQKLEVNFRAGSLEDTIRRAGRRLALGLTAGAAILATSLTALSERVAGWVPVTFGAAAAVLTVALVADLVRRNR